MTESLVRLDGEIRCRCGQVGVITGIQGPVTAPELVWVTHEVRAAPQTHIHRAAQMKGLLAQTTANRRPA